MNPPDAGAGCAGPTPTSRSPMMARAGVGPTGGLPRRASGPIWAVTTDVDRRADPHDRPHADGPARPASMTPDGKRAGQRSGRHGEVSS